MTTPTPESQQAALKPADFALLNPSKDTEADHAVASTIRRIDMELRAGNTKFVLDAEVHIWQARVTLELQTLWPIIRPILIEWIKAQRATPVSESHAALAEKLADYKQADDDGVMCLVSRQAVDEAVAALRAHPAGGVSEDVVERVAEWLSYRYGSDLPLKEKASEGRIRWRADARNALRAAGIGAGVVENDK